MEISTAPEITSPEQAREVALKIGELLRATGKVKRGIGTIRQDINVSIVGGARVEIKGVQELNLIPKIIQNEAARQEMLLLVKEELARRKVNEMDLELRAIDISKIFSATGSKIIANQLSKNGVVLGLKLPCFKGLLKNRLGPELAQYAKAAGVKGIFHSEELPGYGISEDELKKVVEELKLKQNDAFVLIAEKREVAERALQAVLRRARLALLGVPEETRVASEDATTSYMRPLPGAARMYPETDIPPIVITKERINKIKSSLPEMYEAKIKRYIEAHGLSEELASQLVKSERAELFERTVKETKISPSVVANTLIGTLKELKREGVETEKITDAQLVAIFRAVERGILAKEAIGEVIKLSIRHPNKPIEDIVAKLGIVAFGEKEVTEIVRKALEERSQFVRQCGAAAEKPIMGVVMKEVRGRCDGALVSKILKLELEKFLRK